MKKMKPIVKILECTKNPLTQIGTNASYCYATKLKDEGHASRIAKECIRAGHGRNMEFATVTMVISNISCRLGRELYTHIGGSPTRVQASTRYINYSNFAYFIPEGLNEKQQIKYIEAMESAREYYRELKELGCSNDITGYIIPLAGGTSIVIKCNVRMLENLFNQRLCFRALREFTMLTREMKKTLANIDSEWKWLSDNLFVPKCVKQGVCYESRPCHLVTKTHTFEKKELYK